MSIDPALSPREQIIAWVRALRQDGRLGQTDAYRQYHDNIVKPYIAAHGHEAIRTLVVAAVKSQVT